MILTVDIGNTTVSFGVLRGQRVAEMVTTEISVPKPKLRLELKKILGCIKKKFPNFECAIICSVVPGVLDLCEKAIRQHLKIKPIIVGRDVKVPMKNNYRNPKQVGQDRLVCAYAAKCLYGQPAIVIDFGTATTFDVISRQGSYEGGIIVSGIRLSAESLFQKTALLPKISTIKGPHTLIGKDTQESMLSGIFFGYGVMCCGLIDQIAKKIKGRPKVVVTGGHTRLMKKFISKKATKIDKDLVFKGMGLLHSRKVQNAESAKNH